MAHLTPSDVSAKCTEVKLYYARGLQRVLGGACTCWFLLLLLLSLLLLFSVLFVCRCVCCDCCSVSQSLCLLLFARAFVSLFGVVVVSVLFLSLFVFVVVGALLVLCLRLSRCLYLFPSLAWFHIAGLKLPRQTNATSKKVKFRETSWSLLGRGPENAQNEPSEAYSGHFCGQGLKVLKMSLLEPFPDPSGAKA